MRTDDEILLALVAHLRDPRYCASNPDDRSLFTFWDKEGTRTMWRVVLVSDDFDDHVWIDEDSGKFTFYTGDLPMTNGAVWDFGEDQFETFSEMLQHMIGLARRGEIRLREEHRASPI